MKSNNKFSMNFIVYFHQKVTENSQNVPKKFRVTRFGTFILIQFATSVVPILKMWEILRRGQIATWQYFYKAFNMLELWYFFPQIKIQGAEGIYVPCCWKETAQSWKNLKAKFLFRERAFHFRDRIFLFRDRTVVWPSVARSDSPDRGNGKLSRGKEEPERFSIEEQTFSSSADTFFLPLKLHDPTHKSFMDYPLFMDTSDLFFCFLPFLILQVWIPAWTLLFCLFLYFYLC